MITKKNIYAIFLLFSMLLTSFLTSCDDLNFEDSKTSSDDSDYCLVTFSISDYESDSRTILPTKADEENLYFTLKAGKKEDFSDQEILNTADTTPVPVEYMSYDTLRQATFRLASGTWYFTLEGYTTAEDETSMIVTGKAKSTISSGNGNAINFEMTPVESGVGSINVIVKYNFKTDTESKVTKIDATLKDLSEENPAADISDSWEYGGASNSQDITPSSDGSSVVSSGSFTYKKSDVAKGRYLLTFKVTSTNTKTGTTQVGVRSDAVIVEPGCESATGTNAATNPALEIKLREVYSITYENMSYTEGGETKYYWKSGYTPRQDYSPYEVLTLPVKDDTNRTDAVFLGWYTESGYGPVPEIGYNKGTDTSGISLSSGPITLYAKWRGKDIFVGSHGKNADGWGSSADQPYKTIAYVLNLLGDPENPNPSFDYTINIVGKVTEDVEIKLTTNSAGSLTFNGVDYDYPEDSPDEGLVKGEIAAASSSAFLMKGVTSPVPVIIKNLIITGKEGRKGEENIYYGGAINIENAGAIFTLSDGAVVTGGTAERGAGIALIKGTLNLEGGSIENCGNSITNTDSKGAGIYIAWGGGNEFNFKKGSVINNGSENILNGGGIYSLGIVNISGTDGTRVISGNQAKDGGGIYIASGNGNFTLDDGTIENNTAVNGSGLYTENANTAMTGGSISSNTATGNGGGVYVGSTGAFTMSGGTIGSNTASTSGGGVYNAGSMFMYGTAVVGDDGATSVASSSNKSNLATYGGGIYNAGSLSVGYNASTASDLEKGIYFNYASSSGGGVYNSSSATKFMVSSGTIAMNFASSTGAGVYNEKIFEFNGGIIIKNTAGDNGGGLYNNGTTYMYGTAVIGDKESATAEGAENATADNCSNRAADGPGGGVFNVSEKNLYLGYSSENTESELSGGIYFNFATKGGGINNAGSLKIKTGDIIKNGKSSTTEGSKAGIQGSYIAEGGNIQSD